MSLAPGPLITSPEPLRRRYGLFTAASGPLDLPPHGRAGGVRYTADNCGQAFAYPIGCANEAVGTPAKRVDDGDPEIEALPFAVVASMQCGSLGYTGSEFEDKIRRRLENGEQGAVEAAFWTGNTPAGADLGIVNLTDSAETVAVGDDQDLAAVVSALEDYAYRDQGYGYTAFIHAPVAAAAWAATQYLIEQDGPLKRTPYGSIWVFGGGYPNNGGIHITGQVNVWRSADAFVYPADQTMDRATNQRILIAEREYAIGFDCFNGRADFDPLGVTSP
jgi:hypothetical protein